jgi:heptosyltransferase-2
MPQKIVIRAPNHLGDCVMALPMINQAGEAYAGARITLLAPRHLAELFINNPGIEEIQQLPPEHVHGMMAVVKMKERLSGGDFDIGYILPPSFGAAAGFKLGGVKERIGYIADGRRLLLTKPLPLPEPINSKHRSELYFDLLRRGTGQDLLYVKPKLFLSDTDAKSGMELLAGFGVKARDRFAAIAFRAVAESRRWGTANYIELIKQLISEHGLKVVLIGSEKDRPEGDQIAAATSTKEVINLAGKTSIREVAGILSHAQLFVGNDSGPAHLAAAVGAPIVVLSGADDPKATSPMAAQKKLIYLEHLECISCEKNKCPLKGEEFMQCMTGIPVAMVAAAAGDLLR